jgi:SAM-dependent methyltransferase
VVTLQANTLPDAGRSKEKTTRHDRILAWLAKGGFDYSKMTQFLGRHGAPVLKIDHLIRALGSRLTKFNERVVEYPWVLSNIDTNYQRVLDVGSSESLLTFELIRLGFETHALDTRSFKGRHPALNFCEADICHSPYREQTFDQIVSVSTIEHIGLGKYGDPTNHASDTIAVQQMRKLVKKNGRVLITTPFSSVSSVTWQRIYDLKSIRVLVSDFEVEKIEVFSRSSDGVWGRCSPGRFSSLLNREPGVICLVLRKP